MCLCLMQMHYTPGSGGSGKWSVCVHECLSQACAVKTSRGAVGGGRWLWIIASTLLGAIDD
jgi:hypothetical protein